MRKKKIKAKQIEREIVEISEIDLHIYIYRKRDMRRTRERER